ncbi:inositol monophosphatase [Phycicoccus endophyticus]|uniref:Inositol-1-monophosphatase n=1 Tax=Phycicoccus endophyticus TaxID=1690220 RepID=A0A7G9R4V6_9MICO|nr:inositol monophosphatase family protein [Phycicoccus endophyticus]NHI18555.1 inositol monophosphatase [Phycicoccus endophyticus]QNN50631.1 inositol monophosphatase [Phycicoccus endophyticus]GGL22807.1 inositol monophosphatase [Phycicoccus endophyticus]
MSAAAGPEPAVPAGVDLAELEEVACRVAREAARLVVEERPEDLGVAAKSTPTDVVTEMDQRSQELLLDRLAALRPRDAVLGEEEGGRDGTSGVTWVVDPIDGTTNYLYRVPQYAVSVAAVVGDPGEGGRWRAVAGAVANPESGELFHAREGGGAWLDARGDTRRLRARSTGDLALALVGTGFGYAPELRARQARLLVELLPAVRDIRRQGSAALDLCAVAAGRLDAYYETGLHAWDRAAGELVAREAGARVGGPFDEVAAQALTWAAAPGVAEALSDRVRALTREHVGLPDAPA